MKLPLSPGRLRARILKMARTGNSVHIPCAFSLVEIVTALYQDFARINPSDIRDPNRDLVCLSKGHGVMAIYAALAELGHLEQKHLDAYFSEGSLLKGLGDAHVPGIEVTGGSLGHGVPVAVGHALGIKMRGQDRRVFCIVGDGEMNEGSVWEALLFAAHWKLNNFILIVDANDFQAMGRVEDILGMESLPDKFRAFNFFSQEGDGHSPNILKTLFQNALSDPSERPKAIVARTVKGKGVSFMEGNNQWHYTRLDDATLKAALKEIESKETGENS